MEKFDQQKSIVRELFLRVKELGGLRLNRPKILLQNLAMHPFEEYSLKELKKIIHFLEEKKR